MFKVILWDIDNTLLDFSAAQKHSLQAQFRRFGLGECSDETVARYDAINNKYWHLLEQGKLTQPQVLTGRFEEFFAGEGMTVDTEAFNAAYEAGIPEEIFFTENGYGYDLVVSLKGKVKQYAVTNGATGVQEERLAKSGLGDLFDGVFISEKVGFDKPSKAYFDAVLRQIEPVEKSEILIVGDSLTSDMQGGNNAGIPTCWYNPHCLPNTRGVKIDYEIRHLQEVTVLIEGETQDACELVVPTMAFEKEIRRYRQEFYEHQSSFDGCGSLRRNENPQDWLDENERLRHPDTLPEGYVVSTQFIYVRKADRKIIGMLQVRHYFNEFLEKYAGHIGYSVRPSERRKGYAKRMLAAALPFCRSIGLDRVLITCSDHNEGSRKTILANGGVYESTVYCESEQENLERYWIDLSGIQEEQQNHFVE